MVVCFFLASLVAGYGQYSLNEQTFPAKSFNVHILDFFRILSPAIKMSFEIAPSKNYSLNYEVSWISDLHGHHLVSTVNPGNVKSINGFSLAFCPMINVGRHAFSGFRINYSLKHRKMDNWVSRFGGNYLQKMEYTHLTNSAGLYYRYNIRTEILDENYLSVAFNAGLLGSYVSSSLPEDVFNDNSTWIDSFQLLKSDGYHLHPHFYIEFNLGFILQNRRNQTRYRL